VLNNIILTFSQKRYVLVVSAGHEVGRRLLSLAFARQDIPVKEGKLFRGYMKVSLPYSQDLRAAVAEYKGIYIICPNEFDAVPGWMP
jgi:hypothetical protein